MAEIFISYARENAAHADRLSAHLTQGGRSVFLDRERLAIGDDWQSSLEAELAAARSVVVLWSAAAVRSRWVRREANLGLQRDILVQVLLEELEPPPPFDQQQAGPWFGPAGEDAAPLAAIAEAVDRTTRTPRGSPDEVGEELGRLVARLNRSVPSRKPDRNFLVATWNVRGLGGLTDKWTAGPMDSPKRDLRSVAALAEVVRQFDLVVIQEVRGDLRALDKMVEILGHRWSVVITDVAPGTRGNDERTAFVFDTDRVIPGGVMDHVELGYAERISVHFATPLYAATFRVHPGPKARRLTLVLTRFLYGRPVAPTSELELLRAWSEAAGVVLVGDFGTDRAGDPTYDALRAGGLFVPPEIADAPRTVFGGGPSKFVDHLAWYASSLRELVYTGTGGHFDFTEAITAHSTKSGMSWALSDHFPLWIELAQPGDQP